MAEPMYRVWVEKFAYGWVTLRSPSETIAQVRARVLAEQDIWIPERTRTESLIVERLRDN